MQHDGLSIGQLYHSVHHLTHLIWIRHARTIGESDFVDTLVQMSFDHIIHMLAIDTAFIPTSECTLQSSSYGQTILFGCLNHAFEVLSSLC